LDRPANIGFDQPVEVNHPRAAAATAKVDSVGQTQPIYLVLQIHNYGLDVSAVRRLFDIKSTPYRGAMPRVPHGWRIIMELLEEFEVGESQFIFFISDSQCLDNSRGCKILFGSTRETGGIERIRRIRKDGTGYASIALGTAFL
jgi:hypothetical protein